MRTPTPRGPVLCFFGRPRRLRYRRPNFGFMRERANRRRRTTASASGASAGSVPRSDVADASSSSSSQYPSLRYDVGNGVLGGGGDDSDCIPASSRSDFNVEIELNPVLWSESMADGGRGGSRSCWVGGGEDEWVGGRKPSECMEVSDGSGAHKKYFPSLCNVRYLDFTPDESADKVCEEELWFKTSPPSRGCL